MGDLLAHYEAWVLSVGTRPTMTMMLVIFSVLSVVTALGYRAWTHSLRAWFWFGLTNVGVWTYLLLYPRMGEGMRDHVRFVLIHFIIGTGVWFAYALAARILLGKEDAVEHRYRPEGG